MGHKHQCGRGRRPHRLYTSLRGGRRFQWTQTLLREWAVTHVERFLLKPAVFEKTEDNRR